METQKAKTVEEKRQEKQIEIIEAISDLSTPSLKLKAVALNELKDKQETEINKQFIEEKEVIKEQYQKWTVNWYNRIRAIVKTTTSDDWSINDTDYVKYNIVKPLDTSEASKQMEPMKYFWRTALINSAWFEINEKDKKVLDYLNDIVWIPIENSYPNFKIEFHFAKNDFFPQEILTKEYHYLNKDDDNWDKCFGTEIDWFTDEKNPTKIISKKVIKKGKTRLTTTTVKDLESFFDIFEINKSDRDKNYIEANYFKQDFMPNILEYYLNIMEIDFDGEEEFSEEEINKKKKKK